MLRKIIILAAAALFLCFTLIFLFLYIKKDFIRDQSIAALNQQLEAEVSVSGKMELVFFSTFPNLVIELNDVLIADKLRSNDTLLKVAQVQLVLNPWKILKKDYTIQGIYLNEGFLHLFSDKNGLVNFNILKASEDNSQEKNAIRLSEIKLNNISIIFEDLQNHVYVNEYVNSSTIMGAFYEEDFDIKLQIDLLNKKLKLNKTELLGNKHLVGKLDLHFTGTTKCITFKENQISIEDNVFNIDGDLCTKANTIHLMAVANGSQLSNMLGLIPSSWLDVNNIQGDGKYSIKAALTGNLDNVKVNMDFSLKDGELALEKEKLQLENLLMQGNYNNISSKAGKLVIDTFSFVSGNSNLQGKLNFEDLSVKSIDLSLNGLIETDLLQSKQSENIDLEDGRIAIEKLSFKLSQSKLDSLWKLSKIEGVLIIDSLAGHVKTLDMPFLCAGTLKGEDVVLSAKKLSLKLGENHLQFDGQIRNLLAMLFNSKEESVLDIGVEGQLYSSYFNLNDFIKKPTENSNNQKDIILPYINGHLKIHIDKFVYQKLNLEDLNINAYAENTSYQFNIAKSKMLGGDFEARLLSNVNNNNFEINLACETSNIDINELFMAFDNFGQKGISQENLKGKLTTQLSLSATWKDFKDFSQEDFVLQSHVQLVDGELINFAPLLSLSGKLEVEQLEHLYFSDMEIDISIINGVINIPISKIQSNLLSLKFGGKHSFDNEIDYQLILNLKNLLAAKFRKNKTTEEDYINDATGGINIYITMTGTVDNPIISLDKKGVKEKIKEDFKAEKQEFKNLFKKDELSEFEKNEIKFEQLKEEEKYLEWED